MLKSRQQEEYQKVILCKLEVVPREHRGCDYGYAEEREGIEL